jgi:hypothetical protein
VGHQTPFFHPTVHHQNADHFDTKKGDKFRFDIFTRISFITQYLYNLSESIQQSCLAVTINPLSPNDPYSGRTAQLTSKRSIL